MRPCPMVSGQDVLHVVTASICIAASLSSHSRAPALFPCSRTLIGKHYRQGYSVRIRQQSLRQTSILQEAGCE
eukprot:scaffold154408_cov28-Tisochrysis_lutea.AAC.1